MTEDPATRRRGVGVRRPPTVRRPPAGLVRDGETGLVAEPNAETLARVIGRVIEDPALAERMGSRAAAQAATMTRPAAIERLVMVK